ncbi:hypothetical protein LTR70_002619 [Exophiala xenobiotica]|uniref:Uncharacterized protein n=1 Tax=Lithohypha guttulata TaxID=1690604 RepID=A0ABR0KII5_9EURO|nr:hypothetical protein LTR24_002204 [Lithohypha guttulata]KAK5325239.1 hypothetical protein LTR70_002619 [Exophiala xenobiotica]
MVSSPLISQSPETVTSSHHKALTLQTSEQLDDDRWKAHTSDDDPDTDDEARIGGVSKDDGDANNLLGVSISRAQTDMKSPATPAATKAQVLDASKSYFGADPDDEAQMLEEPREQDIVPEQCGPGPQWSPRRPVEHEQQLKAMPLPYWAPSPKEKTEKRSSLFSSILGAAGSYTRPRASSGPGMIGGIKKRLPGMPSINLPKQTRPSESGKTMLGSVDPDSVRPGDRGQATREDATWQSEGPDDEVPSSKPTRSRSQLDSQYEAGEAPSTRSPTSLRRATSDQSLYLRRAPTGASDFDDWNQFSDVSEMVNSRKQAITDTWQDSSFRMPKLSLLSYRQGLKPSQRANIGETMSNTKVNTDSLHPSETEQKRRNLSPAVAGEVSKHPNLKNAFLRTKGDLVIMGGYRGSILREAQPPYRQLWIPIKAGINLRKPDLEVGLTRVDELKMEERIIADGALSHVGPIDICRRLIRKCRKCPNVQEGKLRMHDYGYDWRLSPDLLAERLIRFLEGLPCNRTNLPVEERGAWIVAHSLGGVLTRYTINKRPELFAGVVYAGTPQNCVNILGPLRNGDDVMFSSRILTAQVNFSIRTSFALLPHNGRCFINKQTGERYDVNFFDAETWSEHRLSPCIKPALSRNKPEKKTGIISCVSEVLSQQTKRGSWYPPWKNQRNDSQQKGHSSPVSNQVEDAKEDVADAAEAAMPDGPLSSTLAEGSSQSAKNRPAVATQSTIPVPIAKAYLADTLNSILDFKQNLSHIPELQTRNAYPPAGIIYAKNTPTVYGAFVASREEIKYDDAFDDLAFAAGDGVVLASAAQLPVGYLCVRGGRIETERGHVGLLGDLEGVGRCLNAVIDARIRGVGLGAYDR